MKHVTFKQIYNSGQLIFQNDCYEHYSDSIMSLIYDGNFIAFKQLPLMLDLIEAETYLKSYQNKYEQEYLRFTFPPNQTPLNETISYLKKRGYTIGYIELYAIDPSEFLLVTSFPGVTLEVVTEQNLKRYLTLQYFQDFLYGVEFAKQKKEDYQQRFENKNMIQILALYHDTPVGSVDIILSDKTAEIDNLFVEKTYQKRGIGSMLQTKVMEIAEARTVILVADGKDTARVMYKKQNYRYLGFKYEALKVV